MSRIGEGLEVGEPSIDHPVPVQFEGPAGKWRRCAARDQYIFDVVEVPKFTVPALSQPWERGHAHRDAVCK